MSKNSKSKILYIYLNGELVGVLRKKNSGAITLRYSEEWLQNGIAISHSLPLQEDEYSGEVVSRYLDNLLPDNNDIKQNIATKFGAESIRPFDLLSIIGKDCVGALSFLTEEIKTTFNFKMSYSALSKSEIIRRIKTLGKSTPLGMDTEDFRISIAGAQEKTAFLGIDGRWYEPHGLTPTTHIFKKSIGALGLDVNFFDSVDNEWASLFLMKKMGLPVCEAKIEMFEDEKILVIERFDRRWVDYKRKKILVRLPQEDMCQAFGVSPYKKYQNEGGPGIVDIMALLRGSKNEDDRINFFKAIIVFDLLFAIDGHGKNFSVFLEKDGFRMTPFYDVMSGYFLYKREKRPIQKLKLAMKIGKSGHYAFKRIQKRHYEETAKLCGLSSKLFNNVMEEVFVAYKQISYDKKELDHNLNQKTLEIILDGMKERSKIIFNGNS